jgi:hypothetical protein
VSDDDVRARADERRRLLAELELERKQLIRNIETCRIRDIDRPFIGEWSLKDIVGHVASWEAEYVSDIRDLREGKRSAQDPAGTQRDHWNQDHVERKRDLNFWSVLEQLRGGRHRLLDELEHVSDDDLTDVDGDYLPIVRAAMDLDLEHWHQVAATLAVMAGVLKNDPEPGTGN